MWLTSERWDAAARHLAETTEAALAPMVLEEEVKRTLKGTVQGTSYDLASLEDLFRARNKVPHEGRAYWLSGSDKTGYRVDAKTLRRFEMAGTPPDRVDRWEESSTLWCQTARGHGTRCDH